MQPFILGINGSPNPSGHTVNFLSIAMRQAELEGAITETINLRNHLTQIFNATKEQHESEEVQRVIRVVREADGIILATPVHWGNVSAYMKIFMDHLTFLEAPNFPLQGLPVGCLTVCEEDGGIHTGSLALLPFKHLGCIIVPYGAPFHNTSMEGGELDWQDMDIALLGANVVRMTHLTTDHRKNWGYEGMAQPRL